MSHRSPDLPYDQVVFKASHNSYERRDPEGHLLSYASQLASDRDHPSRGGCRGLELDLVQKPGDWQWSVSHPDLGETILRTAYNPAPDHQLGAHLRRLGQWSKQRPGHDPVLVQLDLKWRLNHGGFPEFAERLDAYLRRHLRNGRRKPVFTPGELLRGENTLACAARHHGWPTVGDLRGRFVLVLSGTATRKINYIQTDTPHRLCFADRDYRFGQMGPEIRGNRIFINLRADEDRAWPGEAAAWRNQQGIMIRAWNIRSGRGWKYLQRKGANILATDHVVDKPWALVGANPIAVRGDLEAV